VIAVPRAAVPVVDTVVIVPKLTPLTLINKLLVGARPSKLVPKTKILSFSLYPDPGDVIVTEYTPADRVIENTAPRPTGCTFVPITLVYVTLLNIAVPIKLKVVIPPVPFIPVTVIIILLAGSVPANLVPIKVKVSLSLQSIPALFNVIV
jgi:hypothetical protein